MKDRTLPELNEQSLREMFAKSADVVIESYVYGREDNPIPVLLLFCQGMADAKRISDQVLPHLHAMLERRTVFDADSLSQSKSLQLHPMAGPNLMESIMLRVYGGDLVLFFEGAGLVYTLNMAQPPNRTPEESSTEVSIKGPRDAFTEDVIGNIALVRKRMKTSALCCEKFVIGERSHTTVALMFIQDIAQQEVIEEARRRLTALNVDGLISSAQLEEALADRAFSLFPLIDYVGRPDYVADSLLRGRFAVLVDGSPMALLGPTNLMEILKSPEDVHLPFYYVALERLLRLFGMCVALFLPGFWIAVSGFNLDQIPFPLLATISSARLGLPISGPMDFFLMLVLFELFREAGLRLPKAVGQTVAVVGGLIIGDAAISAGITGPVTLVVAALSTMSMFTLISQSLAGSITVLRLLILITCFMFGMYGFMLSIVGFALYLSTLESFGVPYLTPLSPPKFREMAAGVLAIPWKKQKRRPSFLHPEDATRKGGKSD